MPIETVPRQTGAASSPPPTSSLVVAGRLLLLLLAAVAVVSAFALTRERDHAASAARDLYVCPMHPEVTSAAPAECPICRMELEQVHASKPAMPAPASSARAPAAPSSGSPPPFVCPMHPEVTSKTPDRCRICRMDLEPPRMLAPEPSASAAEPPFSIAESARVEDFKVVGAVKREIATAEVHAAAWIEADGLLTAVLYREDLMGLEPDERGVFFRASEPTVGIGVRLTADPPAAWDASTSRVHFRVDPETKGLASGEVGWVELVARSRELLVIPSTGVLFSPEGPYVLVAGKGRTFTKRHIEIGNVSRGHAVVLSGLSDQEQIAVGSTFSLDAERSLQTDRVGALGAMP